MPPTQKARWWGYKLVKGQPTLHQGLPEARTREEAELAGRQLVKALFDKAYGIAHTTTTLEDFVESTYRKYAEQVNVNKGAKNLYIRLLFGLFKDRPLHSITPQDCRDCPSKMQTRSKKLKKVGLAMPKAYKAAGYSKIAPNSRRYTDDEILSAIRKLSKQSRRMPAYHELRLASIAGKCPSPGTIVRRIGKLTDLKPLFER